jgi:hypothetical protein
MGRSFDSQGRFDTGHTDLATHRKPGCFPGGWFHDGVAERLKKQRRRNRR